MSEPLFRRVLGAQFKRLPVALRALHDRGRNSRAVGRCAVRHGRTRLARALARLLRLPPPAADIPLAVDFVLEKGGETKRRDFAGVALMSHLRAGSGALEGLIVERRFPLAVAMRLVPDASGLTYEPLRYWLFGLPWPSALAPRAMARERSVEGVFTFDVTVAMPLLGTIISYRGRLRPASSEEAHGDVGRRDHAVVSPTK